MNNEVHTVPFFIDPAENSGLTYSELISYLSTLESLPRTINSTDPLKVFKTIIAAIIYQKEIVLLDETIDIEQTQRDSLSYDLSNKINTISSKLDLTEKDLQKALSLADSSRFKLTLFTSGTTGRPKSVTHSLKSLGKNIRVNQFRSKDVWAFCYHPTHFAGIQVLLQAVANLNPLIYVFRATRTSILKAVEKHTITNISATPSFLRLLLPPNKSLPSVLRITSGGERFDENSLLGIKSMFPNAKVTNIYASTEAGSLFHSDNGSEFIVPERLKNLVSIEENELLLHKSLLGESLSQEIKGDWFNTGDLVEITLKEPLTFRFISRKSELINVGGVKVNPLEVEKQLLAIDGILQARVSSRKNSILGQIVVAEVVIDKISDFKEIKKIIRSDFDGPHAPRKVTQVDKLEYTRTGKLKRT